VNGSYETDPDRLPPEAPTVVNVRGQRVVDPEEPPMRRWDVALTVRVTVEAEDREGAFDRAREAFLDEYGADNTVAMHATEAAADAPLSELPPGFDDGARP